MTIISKQIGSVGQVGITPRRIQMVVTDSLAVLTAPNYLQADHLYPDQILPTDIIDMDYSWNSATHVGTYIELLVNITAGIITLVPVKIVSSQSIILTAAQVLAAYATPQLLIASPGTGSAIMLLNNLMTTEVSTAFAGGGVGIVQYGTTVHGAGTDALSATIPAAEVTAAASQIYTMTGYAATTVTSTASVTGLGIYFSNATGPFTGGAGSTLTFNLNYMTIGAV